MPSHVLYSFFFSPPLLFRLENATKIIEYLVSVAAIAVCAYTRIHVIYLCRNMYPIRFGYNDDRDQRVGTRVIRYSESSGTPSSWSSSATARFSAVYVPSVRYLTIFANENTNQQRPRGIIDYGSTDYASVSVHTVYLSGRFEAHLRGVANR